MDQICLDELKEKFSALGVNGFVPTPSGKAGHYFCLADAKLQSAVDQLILCRWYGRACVFRFTVSDLERFLKTIPEEHDLAKSWLAQCNG
ncbi:hypothetical protein HY628_02315 [Candidatus Uhrbacteria bacterium]|nr:hypothetical protein [Candidatus Uhrbacteria bacterium]